MLVFSALGLADAATPLGKVVLLSSGLPTILRSEGKTEWCEERSKTLRLVDRTGKDEVAKSLATIESQTAVVASLNSEVEQLEINSWTVEVAELEATIWHIC